MANTATLRTQHTHTFAMYGSASVACEGKDIKRVQLCVHLTVLIVDDNLAPLQWHFGRIIDIHPGTDRHTRVVTLRTKGGTTKRAVKKICLLPLDGEDVKE